MTKLTQEEERELVEMYHQVEADFANFPELQTTEDLFSWRERVKGENKENGKLRNQIIEEKIKGNKSLELLYAWSKFTRMVDRAKAGVSTEKVKNGIVSDKYRIKAASMLHQHLVKENKANIDKLFGIYKIEELSLGVKYPKIRSFNTPYEYEKALVKEDEQEAWPAVLFVALMNAYGIEKEDLLTVGRQAEKKGNEYIADIRVESIAKASEDAVNNNVPYVKK